MKKVMMQAAVIVAAGAVGSVISTQAPTEAQTVRAAATVPQKVMGTATIRMHNLLTDEIVCTKEVSTEVIDGVGNVPVIILAEWMKDPAYTAKLSTLAIAFNQSARQVKMTLVKGKWTGVGDAYSVPKNAAGLHDDILISYVDGKGQVILDSPLLVTQYKPAMPDGYALSYPDLPNFGVKVVQGRARIPVHKIVSAPDKDKDDSGKTNPGKDSGSEATTDPDKGKGDDGKTDSGKGTDTDTPTHPDKGTGDNSATGLDKDPDTGKGTDTGTTSTSGKQDTDARRAAFTAQIQTQQYLMRRQKSLTAKVNATLKKVDALADASGQDKSTTAKVLKRQIKALKQTQQARRSAIQQAIAAFVPQRQFNDVMSAVHQKQHRTALVGQLTQATQNILTLKDAWQTLQALTEAQTVPEATLPSVTPTIVTPERPAEPQRVQATLSGVVQVGTQAGILLDQNQLPTTRTLAPGTRWRCFGVVVRGGLSYYNLGNGQYLLQAAGQLQLDKGAAPTGTVVPLTGVATIRYVAGYGVQLWHRDGTAAADAQGGLRKLGHGSRWRVQGMVAFNGRWYYHLGGDQYVDAAYVGLT